MPKKITTVQRIFTRLLYLTPAGYLLSLANLLDSTSDDMVKVQISRDKPFLVFAKSNPTFNDRFNWLLNALSLGVQSWFAVGYYLNTGFSIAGAYGFVAGLISFVTIVSVLFPRFPWNRKVV